ncbi:ABC transporter permease [Clostridium fermenticellae]|uniref:ABC transporter permease n=1 Tax=Clostridium fermenticellae TaxID=2068654 RepID=A0A386H583_9CLOT|nr:ABC transporter permease [Clostridium fermenticellae]AYD40911.1 ABC transporter permease [Clostridium fermenticellae]
MLFKNTLIKIKKSFGKYMSLFIIVMVGFGFFLGLKETSPDIINSVDKYYKANNLMDFKIVSTMGLRDEDVKAIKSLKGVQNVVPSYSLDVLEKDKVIRVHAIENSVNTSKLINGRIPKTDKECVADIKKYKIGDKITLDNNSDNKLKNTVFTVVGTIKSPLYIDFDYGNTTIGDGKLSSFIFINKDNFNIDAYTEIYVTAAGTKNIPSYSQKYDDISEQINNELVKLKPEMENAAYYDIYNSAMDKINDNQNKLNTKMNISTIEKPKWYIYNRNDAVSGYNDLKNATNTITSVAAVFPLFIILIVILMTSNTMSRMIMEEREELGTLTSLGFKNSSIISTYLFYVLSSTVLGTIAGFFIFGNIIPNIVYSTFSKFILPQLTIQHDITSLLMVLIVVIALMTSVTVFSCSKALKQKPAILMRPVPPQNGQRILLEKIGFIWKHLSFNSKTTMRNIFRYKQRVIMIIVGVAGCTALLVGGFGIRDSINGVAEKQYSEIFKYNTLITLKNDTANVSGNLKDLLVKERVKNPLLIKQAAFKAKSNDQSLDTYLVVPEDESLFKKYYNLRSQLTENNIKINDNSVVITQKLAGVLKIGKGDTIKVKDADNNLYSLKVSDVTKNYMQNYIYINKNLYGKVFRKDISYNMIVTNYNQNKNTLAKHLLDDDSVVNVTFKDDILKKAADGNKSLNNVVILLVVIASMLVIIVLYNLTSINMSERKREIATLKVLGFHNNETNQYIYRETFLLTLIGIVSGLLLGIPFHQFVINAIEISTEVFFKNIHTISFVWSFLIIMLVSIIMQIVTHFKIRKIDMIESLKSVE